MLLRWKSSAVTVHLIQIKFVMKPEFLPSGPFLMIQLNRFSNHLRKINTLVKGSLVIDGSFFINVEGFKYQLIAVIDHQGTSQAGHYTAILEHSKRWFKCDDAKLSQNIHYLCFFSEKLSICLRKSI